MRFRTSIHSNAPPDAASPIVTMVGGRPVAVVDKPIQELVVSWRSPTGEVVYKTFRVMDTECPLTRSTETTNDSLNDGEVTDSPIPENSEFETSLSADQIKDRFTHPSTVFSYEEQLCDEP